MLKGQNQHWDYHIKIRSEIKQKFQATRTTFWCQNGFCIRGDQNKQHSGKGNKPLIDP